MRQFLGWCSIALGFWTGEAARAQGPEERPKTAVVNIQELFRGYYKTQEAQRKINAERARIQKERNQRRGRIQALEDRIRQLTRLLQDPSTEPKQRVKLEREIGMHFTERDLLERQDLETTATRSGQLDQKMMIRMDAILQEIKARVAEEAEHRGFDMVFDIDGQNTTQVPALLFAKGATNLTAPILRDLNKKAPSGF